ncbi:MAG TPA: aminoglycoside phosphotransferase [Nocardioidaceae bacterium]|nr:aminoglycoside phosphotransferase [Nocardioidaceae bacterium]
MTSAVPGPDYAAYLGQQRWFGGKGRAYTVTGTTTVARLQDESEDRPEVRLVVVHVAYEDGDTETYQLPLVAYAEPVEYLAHVLLGEETSARGRRLLYDALHDKEVTGLWVDGIAGDRTVADLAFHRDPTATELPPGGPSIVVGAEQSNTSLIFGDSLILKVFRKVSPGLNPDIEVHSALARAASPHIAVPLGWLDGSWTDPASGERVTASLAMAQVFLKDATEGWELALTSVRDLYAEADLHADEVGGDFAGEAERLGRATAEVHAALAEVLPTARLDRKELTALADGMRARLERTATEVPDLAPFVDGLRAAFDDLAAFDGPVHVQRVHGDFHLGQVMRTLQGWKLLDFEGEPARPLEDRRALESPVKDVAGMLRSFDYAARHLLADHPPGTQRAYRGVEWAERNREAFLDGYAAAGLSDPREQPVLLRAFETDKAVYEVLYEARNRPTWLQIPMAAISRLATQTAKEQST